MITEVRYAAAAVTKASTTGGQGIVEVLASMDILDRQNEVMEASAFAHDLNDFHVGTIPALVDHRPEAVVGSVIELKQRGGSLFAAIQLDLGTERGQDTYERLLTAKSDDRDAFGCSIGFEVISSRTDANGIRHLEDVRLREVSILLDLIPAVPTARVIAVKSASDNDTDAIVNRLDRLEREHGIVRTKSTPTDAELRARIRRLEGGARSDDDVRRELERVEKLVNLGHDGDGLGGRDGIGSPDGVTVLG